MSGAGTTPPRFDVEACFRRFLGSRRHKGSTADRDRRIRAATRATEFELGEWERDRGERAEPERSRLGILSKAAGHRPLAAVARRLLRAAGLAPRVR
jgi:hypothetical protein